MYNLQERLFEMVFDHKNDITSVCFFVNKQLKLLDWSFTYYTLDLYTLNLKVSDLKTIHIHNVHNLHFSKEKNISQKAILVS